MEIQDFFFIKVKTWIGLTFYASVPDAVKAEDIDLFVEDCFKNVEYWEPVELGIGLKYDPEDWKGCLDSLGFTEGKNESFGGMSIYDEEGIPKWTYETKEEQEKLFLFFRGASYWQAHEMLKAR